MKKSLKILIIAAYYAVIILGVYLTLNSQTIGHVSEREWATSKYPQSDPSDSSIERGFFEARVHHSSEFDFGSSLIQQGDNPHGWWNCSAKLKTNLTIVKGEQQQLAFYFKGKRTSPIEWLSNDSQKRANNIGILLVGDVGLGYYNQDVTSPHALFIDIWLDTNPSFQGKAQLWQGIAGAENDYHSGYSVFSMPEIGKEYEINLRIDDYIRDALQDWRLQNFKLMMVQCYIEGKASDASMEVMEFVLCSVSH
jgi:hypothetical protein